MKKIVSIFIIALFIVLLCAAAQAGGNKAETATPAATPAATSTLAPPGIIIVDVYSGMQDHPGLPLYTYKESAQVQIFQDVIDHAERLPGMADLRPSDYTAVLHYKDSDKKLFLWVAERSASLMYENDIGTLYKVESDYAVKLYKLLQTGGGPDDSSSLEAENDIVSVRVLETGGNGLPLYTFTEPSDTVIFYGAMKHASRLEAKASMEIPGYRLDITDSSGSREVTLWLGESDAELRFNDSQYIYRVRGDDSAKLRALFDKYIVPIEEIAELSRTGDIDLILKYPAPDMTVEPLEEGFGCWTAENRDALNALLSSADGKVEFILPSDENLTLEKAILRNCSDITAFYRDEITGSDVIYSAINGNRDFYPWESGWKEAEINGYRCYKLVLERKDTEATLIYLQYEGWTIIEQITGGAGKADVERCMRLEIYSWNDGMPPAEPGGLLIEGNENIKNARSAAGDAAFEQHHNSYYESVRTSNIENLGRFLSERLGFREYYYYNGSEEDLPLDRVNVEYDGERVTFLLGDVDGDEYKAFSYTWGPQKVNGLFGAVTGGCPSVPGEVNITVPPEEIKDFGVLTIDGVTYHYSVTQNYKKYITHIEWENVGIRFSIDTRTSRMQPVNVRVISDWVSRVTQVPLG